MCTAAVYKTKDFYFGRNLDYEFPYGEEVTVTPRNYPFHFRFLGVQRFADAGNDHLFVKVRVGDGGEEIHSDEMVDLSADFGSQAAQMRGDSGNPAGNIY